jgi:hypothetical protein
MTKHNEKAIKRARWVRDLRLKSLQSESRSGGFTESQPAYTYHQLRVLTVGRSGGKSY